LVFVGIGVDGFGLVFGGVKVAGFDGFSLVFGGRSGLYEWGLVFGGFVFEGLLKVVFFLIQLRHSPCGGSGGRGNREKKEEKKREEEQGSASRVQAWSHLDAPRSEGPNRL